MCALSSSSPILVRHVLREATSAADFLANWAYTHRVSQCFLCSQDLPVGLPNILYLDAYVVP